LSYTSEPLETYYQLALQHAWERNLDKSIAALSHVLHLNKCHIPSIHLLTLVLTALEDFEKALQTCHTVKLDEISGLGLDDIVALLEMQLTYLRIVEVVSGKDLALEVQKGVFKLYSRLLGPKSNAGFIKKQAITDQRDEFTDLAVGRIASNVSGISNVPESRHVRSKRSLGGQSMQSKLSLQVPGRRSRRTHSLLRKKPRSRSVDGRSLRTRSSAEFSEKAPSSFLFA